MSTAWRLRLVVYGLLAVCVVLVLAARPDEEHEVTVLRLDGRTSKGEPVVLEFVDGELRSVRATTLAYCSSDGSWAGYDWSAVAGSFAKFHQEDSTFRVRERREYGTRSEPGYQVIVGAMHGRLADGGDSARGTLYARYEWGNGGVCVETVRFSARQTL